ncbi:MAG: 40S ribosomal protein S6 [Amphiamblys sp. WSBS2006]|nr:MAG: 40S ribosomal protein S6 [Amphiamblys sp. WSBS2006]
MKLNIAFPAQGTQKIFEVTDERKLHTLYEKRIGDEIDGVGLGEGFAGYNMQITGGCDKQGFPMSAKFITRERVRPLLNKGDTGYRQKRRGVKKRKPVRGCIVTQDISVVSLTILERGEGEIEGLTDKTYPKSLGPKRASRIRKMFGLSAEDDVRDYVIGKELPPKVEGGEPRRKFPKIQRLVTQEKIDRSKLRMKNRIEKRERSRKAAAEYKQLLSSRGL